LSRGAIRKAGIASHRLGKLKKNKKEKRKTEKEKRFLRSSAREALPVPAVAPPPVPAAPSYGGRRPNRDSLFEIL
jgi:hypothetical protein